MYRMEINILLGRYEVSVVEKLSSSFHCREMLPSTPNIACLGALTYTAIAKVMSESGDDKDKLLQAHHTVNGKMNLNKAMIIFPCRTRYLCITLTYNSCMRDCTITVVPGIG